MSPELKESLDRRQAEWNASEFANMPGIDIALKVSKMNEKAFGKYSPEIQRKLIDIYNSETRCELSRTF